MTYMNPKKTWELWNRVKVLWFLIYQYRNLTLILNNSIETDLGFPNIHISALNDLRRIHVCMHLL